MSFDDLLDSLGDFAIPEGALTDDQIADLAARVTDAAHGLAPGTSYAEALSILLTAALAAL